MLQAGRREFGTYAFHLERLWPQLSEEIRQLREEQPHTQPTGGLSAFFSCFPHPHVVEALFLLAETQRIAHRVGQSYRGLRGELEWLNSLSLPSLLPETLRTLFAALTIPHSRFNTVYDSARWAAETYQRIVASLAIFATSGSGPGGV